MAQSRQLFATVRLTIGLEVSCLAHGLYRFASYSFGRIHSLGAQMQADLVREIAESIVRDGLLLNWRFYFLVSAIGSIAGMAGYWLAPYLKRRAETYATKADMDEVLRQVTLTTRATEEVRSAVAQADWVSREWQTTRRLKLEELMSSVYQLDQWLDLQQSKWLHAEKADVDGKPMDSKAPCHALFSGHETGGRRGMDFTP